MDAKTVFTKTAKGVTQVNQKTQSLSRDMMKVLKAIDGRSSADVLTDKADLAMPALTKLLSALQKDGYVKVFEVKKEEPLTDFGGVEDDFDFTAPKKPAFDPSATASFKPSQYRTPASAGQVERASASAPAHSPAPAATSDAELTAALALAREKAQTEARARTEREAQLRARLDVEAKARRDAEERALEEARRAQAAAETARLALDAKIAEEKTQRDTAASNAAHAALTREQTEKAEQQQKALAAARAAAEAEAQALSEARSRAETEARALAEARVQAEAAAKRQQQEFEAAQRDLRHQLKEEIEAKVRAEMETLLKSDVEESARAEVEAAIMAEARDDARRMLEEQLVAERSMLARVEIEAKQTAEVAAKKMLAEQEVRIRAEMEAQIARIREESARVEAESRKMAEAQTAAAAKASAEFAVRLKAEEDARRAAEAEAETRKQLETQNRQRLEARVREEAADRARVEAEMQAKLKTEKEAKVQAQARMLVEQEMREKSDRESQARLDAERKARAEAEQKALAEMKAREIASREAADQAAQRARIEQETEGRIAAEREKGKLLEQEAEARIAVEREGRKLVEQEAEARIAVEREGRKLVEQEAEARIAVERQGREKAEEKSRAEEVAEQLQRDAQVARLRELADQNEQAARDEAASGPKPKKRKRKGGSTWRLLALGVAALVVLAVVLVQVIPLGAVNLRLAKSLAEWLHDDVSSGSLKVALLPRPHVRIENLSLGRAFDAKAASGKLYMDLATLFGDRFVIDTLELSDVTIAADALPRALKWADSEGRGKGIEIGKIALRRVKVDVSGVVLEEFDADLKLDTSGKVIQASARARDGKWNLDVAPNKTPAGDAVASTAVNDPWAVEFGVRGLNLPLGAPLPISNLAAKGTMFDGGMVFSQVDVKMFEGTGNGNLKISWKQGVSFNGELGIEKIKVDQLTQVFTRDVSLSGKLEGRFSFAGDAATVGALLDKPNIQGNFEVKDGTIGNVDLVQVMRSPGSVGGQSKFSDLTGQLRISDGIVRYEKLKLVGGVLLANGNVNVVLATSVLSGGVTSEIRSSVAQDRAAFSVGGKVSRPALRRGG